MDKKEPEKKKMNKAELEAALVENFINLQRVLTNLSLKFDELSANISKMLQLFEISAKSMAEKYSKEPDKVEEAGLDKEFIKKLDSLLDQNKTISKAIMMMEERVRNKNAMPELEIKEEPQPKEQPRFDNTMFRSRPLPK